MLSNHKLQTAIEELKEISRMDLSLYNENGGLAVTTFDISDDMEDIVRSFTVSMAESQTLRGMHFFKVMRDEQLLYTLIVKDATEQGHLVGKMVCAQLRYMAESYQEQFDKNIFMQNIILGNMLVVDMYNKARKLRIDQSERVVFLVEVEGKKDTVIMETLKNIFDWQTKDFVTEIDEQNLIIIKDVRGILTEKELDGIAKMISDTVEGETMTRVRVSYGNRALTFQDIAKSYQEAKLAVDVGRIFYAEKKTISYATLGIGRLIYQLPMSLCEMFIQEVFGDEIPDVFSEENMITIQKFFENNLNISETARQLYVHRNTLVYRLERLEKLIGLDIRKFEDAMTFKIALMVLNIMSYQKNVEISELLDQNLQSR
ncbi:MAG: PucR family transcriptional regulator [Lachnospiraceae bacterium]